MKLQSTIMAAAMVMASCAGPQQKETGTQEFNDSNTPLHLLKPDYVTPYDIPTAEQIKADMDRVLHYVEECTPMRVVSESTGEEVTDFANMPADAQLERGTFRLTSYEWGVLYSAMLAAAEATGNDAYRDYAINRMNYLAEMAPHFRAQLDKNGKIDVLMRQVVDPRALDDAGAICAAMIKAQTADSTLRLTDQIARYMDFIENKEYRLADGTFARTRPHINTLWLDDMFMGVPSLAVYSRMPGADNAKYIDAAMKQIDQFHKRMWVPEKKLFRHGWVEDMEVHPAFHWARANGWALLTMTELLDVMPENHPRRGDLMKMWRDHVNGLMPLQNADGFWHQLLDRNDTYAETSATAIYAYCLAHGINRGWLDAKAYGPQTQLAWNAVASKINAQGQVEGTCVGTGMGYDPAFYAYRPVSAYAAHGYGPVIWAGAEMVTMMNNQHPKSNDSGIQYYRTEQTAAEPIFHATGL